jgi:putative hydrolase of the HAD superfamily
MSNEIKKKEDPSKQPLIANCSLLVAKYKTIFFDAGGTLLHPHPSVGEIYQQAAARYGCVVEAKKLDMLFREAWLRRDGLSSLASHSSEKIERDWWRNLVEEVFSSVGGVPNFNDFFHELYDHFGSAACWRLYPEVPEVLKQLKSQNKKLGIISNWDSRLFKLCDSLELNQYFDFILISAVFGASKPSPKIFEEALRHAGAGPHEAIHIGDSLEDDIHGAKRVGIDAILIDRHPEKRKKHEGVRMIHTLSELLSSE